MSAVFEISIHVNGEAEVRSLEESATSILAGSFHKPVPGAELEDLLQFFNGVLEFRSDSSTQQVVGLNDYEPTQPESFSRLEVLVHQNDARG